MRGYLSAIVVLLSALAFGTSAKAQSVMPRSPNLDGDWVGASRMLYFNFVHRFTASSAPERKVTSAPTFLIAAGLPARTLIGAHYATNSELSPRYPNEWELFGRIAVLNQKSGAPLDLGAQVGYNFSAKGPDGEVSVARQLGIVRVLAAFRVLEDPDSASSGSDAAVGTGVVVRLTQHLALSGDLTTLTERTPGEEVAWSAGINLAIPRTPHTLSLHATNVNNATLQSSSRGTNQTRYGFEFTIPLTLSRYFGGGGAPPSPRPQPTAREPGADTVSAGGATVSATVQDFSFGPATLELKAGTTVTWTNEGQVVHTVTAEDGSFDSGEIQPGERRSITFSRPGTYAFHCTPHPFMKGRVVVK